MSGIGHYDNNPAGRNYCLVVGHDTKWGRDRNQSPNLELEIARSIMPWFGATFLAEGDDRGINAAAVFFDWLTDGFAFLGLDEAELNEASFNAVKTAFASFPISVLVTDQSSGRDLFAKLSEYGDFWLRRDLAGLIELGFWAQGNIDTSTLPIIGSSDLLGEPPGRLTAYDDCFTEVKVSWKDRDHFYHDAVATAFNPGLARVIGRSQSTTIDRPWLTDSALVQQYAQQWLQKFARPGGDGDSLPIKLSSVEAIEDTSGNPIVGQLVKLDIASETEEIVIRVTRCKYPDDAGGSCSLTYEIERSIWPVLFIQPPPGKIGNFLVKVPAIVNYRLIELPSGLKTSTALQIAILAQRPRPNVVGFHVHDSPDDDTFSIKNPPCTFAAFGKVTTLYPNTTPDIDTTIGMEFELFGVDLVPPAAGQLFNYVVLCFVDNEIMAIGLTVPLGDGIYKSNTWRGRYGTTKANHAVDAPCYFILRQDIEPLDNKDWDIGETWHFKLGPYDTKQDFDIADFTSFSHTFGGGAVPVPNAIGLSPSFVITTEGKVDSRITVSWAAVNPDADISSYNVSWKKATFDSVWQTTNTGGETSVVLKLLEPNFLYDVRVQAVNSKGESSAWSVIVTVTTAAPNVPGTPSGFTITPGVASVRLAWTNAGSDAIRGTQILFSLVLGDDTHLSVIDEVPINETSYTHTTVHLTSFLFYAVRHINTLGVNGARTASLATLSLTDAPTIRVSTPLIGEGATGSGTIGTANFRVLIVDQQGSAGPADLFFSINDGAFAAYSETGNYKTTTTGTVLPTNNNGEISCGVGDKIVAYAVQLGFLQSAFSQPFYNNATNSPDRGGTGGGTPIARLP